jgi:hypothetical protein
VILSENKRAKSSSVRTGRACRRMVAVLAVMLLGVLNACDEPAAQFACPAPGTVFALSMPIAMSKEPKFRFHVLISEKNGYDCHILSEGVGDYWLHAALIDSNRQKAWLAAAEELWPLKAGNKTHAYFVDGQDVWMVDYRVEKFEKFEARVGTYDAYKVVGTLSVNGKLFWTTTLWWAPALKYTISYRLVRANDNDNRYWEIASFGDDDS